MTTLKKKCIISKDNGSKHNKGHCTGKNGCPKTTTTPSYLISKEKTSKADDCICDEESEGDNDDVFQHYRSSEIINKRPAEFSPETPRKRMSTSMNDVTDAAASVAQHLQQQHQQDSDNSVSRKIPTFLNLTSLKNDDDGFTDGLGKRKSGGGNSMLLEVPSICEMRISDDNDTTSLYRSESMQCYRKPFLNDRSPTTPMIRRRDDSPAGTLRKKMRVSTNNHTITKHTPPLSRARSVHVTPQFLRMHSESGSLSPRNGGGGGSISNHHTNQLLNRTYSGYFKRAPSSLSIAVPSCGSSTLRRQGSFKVVSSKVNKVKRCYSTASVIKRKEKAAVGRKPSNALQKRPRRCSEPFVLDSLTLQNKWNRKQSNATRGLGKRRLSTTAVLPTSSKHKLQALAKDELLASLNVPLTGQEEVTVSSPEEAPNDTADEQEVEIENAKSKKQGEKERRETKRLLIMEEVLETEKNYISCLETLNAVFRSQLEGTNIISEKDLNSLFPPHLHNIKEAHMLFMTELEERMNNDDYKGVIGDIFARMTSASVNLLEIYTAYVNAFPKSISTLSKCTRSSNKFRKFLEDCYENPMVERLDLPSFLLSPVQRLPRYILLLRELLKYTDEDHPDKYFISEAMNEMELLISSLNSSIHNSMEFYSASDSRRKKLSRQLTSKKRKQRTSSTILRSSKNVKPVHENKSDNDQGYCSLGERKDESPEDDTPGRKPRASTWRGKRSMSMISASSEEGGKLSNGHVVRRKNDLSISNRNCDSRKSWRRSIGAVFSNLWSASKDDPDDQANQHNNHSNTSTQNNTPTQKSSKHYLSLDSSETIDIDITEVAEEESVPNTPNTPKSPVNDNMTLLNSDVSTTTLPVSRKSSQSRRKVAIIHTSPSMEETMLSPVLDDNENKIQQINELVENTSIDDSTDNGPRPHETSTKENGRCSSRTSTSSERCFPIDSEHLKKPISPQNFRRGGKLRGSAGPVLKSIFQRGNSKIKKTLSMDELNVNKYDHHCDEKKKRFSMSLKKQRSKEHLHKINSGTTSQLSTDEYSMVNSLSTQEISGDNHSASSTETISSKTSTQSGLHDEGEQCHDNNNFINSKTKERRNKLLKTFKSFVGKK